MMRLAGWLGDQTAPLNGFLDGRDRGRSDLQHHYPCMNVLHHKHHPSASIFTMKLTITKQVEKGMSCPDLRKVAGKAWSGI